MLYIGRSISRQLNSIDWTDVWGRTLSSALMCKMWIFFKTNFQPIRGDLIPMKKKSRFKLRSLSPWLIWKSDSLYLVLSLFGNLSKTTYLEEEWNNDYIGIGNSELVQQCREQLTQIEIIILTKVSIMSSLWKKIQVSG